jgi:TPR repeat protein
VFVSYARDDRSKVEQIATALEARGFDVWWDPELLPGETYAQKIQNVLQTCKAVLVVWSKTSAARPWVLDEAAVGLNRGILVPILIDKIEAPLGFRQLQTEDLSGYPAPAAQPNFERLVTALQRLRQDPTQPVPPSPPRPPAPPPVKPANIGRRVAMIAGAVALLGLAGAALMRVVDGIGPDEGDAVVMTTQPGVEEAYGLTDIEIAAEDVDQLITRVLERTTIDQVRDGANGGDGLGQALMCLAYDYGQGLAPDATAARGWCQKASEAAHPLGQYLMSAAYRYGNYGTPTDIDRAQELVAAAAENGDARAMHFIGTAYLNGSDGFPNDNDLALVYLRQAAEKSHRDSQFNLAWMYENGRGVPQDYATALVWYKKLADEGEAIGVRAVGWMTYKGWGVARDPAKAAELYQQASDMGDWAGSRNLALMYETGDGVAMNIEEAKRLLGVAESQVCTSADDNSEGCTSVMADLKRLGVSP